MKYIGATISFNRNELLYTKKELDSIGGNAAAFFMKPNLSKVVKLFNNNTTNIFNESMKGIATLPHASYAINLASNNYERADESVNILVNEVKLADQLNTNVVFHPGACDSLDDGISNVVRGLNKVHEMTEYKEIKHKLNNKLTHTGITIIETMGARKESSIIGKRFNEIGTIINQIKDKRRIGVCIDTCHLFVSGYDIRTEKGWNDTINEFDKEIGLKYLRGIHLNDSFTDFDSGRDKHAPIGKGKINTIPFQCIMKDKRFDDIPLVTETHLNLVEAKKEIDLLKSFI